MKSDSEILNVGLNLAMEFGENWLQPITVRLMLKFIGMGPGEARKWNDTCKNAMKMANDWVYRRAELNPGIRLPRGEFDALLKNAYPGINEENISRLYSQACYYASKDGLAFE